MISRHIAAAAAVVALASAAPVSFSNIKPRLDTSGKIMNAHDGTTRQFSPGGPWFYSAMSYPPCNETGQINGCTSCSEEELRAGNKQAAAHANSVARPTPPLSLRHEQRDHRVDFPRPVFGLLGTDSEWRRLPRQLGVPNL